MADSAITVGGILLVVTALQGIEFDGSRAPRKAKAGRNAPDRPPIAPPTDATGRHAPADG